MIASVDELVEIVDQLSLNEANNLLKWTHAFEPHLKVLTAAQQEH